VSGLEARLRHRGDRLDGGLAAGQREQRVADEDEHDAQADHQGGDAEGDDRGEQRATQERGVHRGLAQRVVLLELGVGLAAGRLEGVVLDDVGLRERGPRRVDLGAAEVRRVLGDGDVLLVQLAADHAVGHATRDDEDDAGDGGDDADDASSLRAARRCHGRHVVVPFPIPPIRTACQPARRDL
jgi:hypothetical protein